MKVLLSILSLVFVVSASASNLKNLESEYSLDERQNQDCPLDAKIVVNGDSLFITGSLNVNGKYNREYTKINAGEIRSQDYYGAFVITKTIYEHNVLVSYGKRCTEEVLSCTGDSCVPSKPAVCRDWVLNNSISQRDNTIKVFTPHRPFQRDNSGFPEGVTCSYTKI